MHARNSSIAARQRLPPSEPNAASATCTHQDVHVSTVVKHRADGLAEALPSLSPLPSMTGVCPGPAPSNMGQSVRDSTSRASSQRSQ
jgi:hypothetical protein